MPRPSSTRPTHLATPASRLALAVIASLAAALGAAPALADVTVGVSIASTGPSASLGIPQKNSMPLLPETIAGEKIRYIVLDDGSDPTQATKVARRFVSEDKVDIILGSSAVAPSIAIAEVADESQTVQLAFSPIELKPGRGEWTYRLAQPVKLMAEAVADAAHARGVKTIAFIGFADAYGETWLKEFTTAATARGMRLVATERYARSDTSVTAQTLKLIAARPDAVLIAGAGTGAALPHTTLRERGYAGPVYHTHGAATKDLIRIGGKAVNGSILPAGPVIVAEQLPDSAATKKPGLDYGPLREAVRPRHPHPVRRPPLRCGPGAATHRAGGAQAGQAGHAGVPPRAQDRAGERAQYRGVARRAELHRAGSFRL